MKMAKVKLLCSDQDDVFYLNEHVKVTTPSPTLLDSSLLLMMMPKKLL